MAEPKRTMTAARFHEPGKPLLVEEVPVPRPAPDDHFTGAARVDSGFQGSAPARISGARVLFEPGARTAWHTHPLGQTLIVTAGTAM